MSTSGLLRAQGITPKAIADIRMDNSPTMKPDGTTQDVVAQAKAGKLRAVYFREGLLRDIINILTVGETAYYSSGAGWGREADAGLQPWIVDVRRKKADRFKNFVQIDKTALLDNDQKTVRAGLSQASSGILFIPHLHRFFGGPIKAEFSKATPLIQKAFLADDPVIIGTSTEIDYKERLSSVSAISENSQIIRVPEPSIDETLEILKILKSHLEADYKLTVTDDALSLAVRLAKRYFSTSPLPRSAEQLLHRTAAMVSIESAEPTAVTNLIGQAILIWMPEDIADCQPDDGHSGQ